MTGWTRVHQESEWKDWVENSCFSTRKGRAKSTQLFWILDLNCLCFQNGSMSSSRATFCSKQRCQKFRITQESSRQIFGHHVLLTCLAVYTKISKTSLERRFQHIKETMFKEAGEEKKNRKMRLRRKGRRRERNYTFNRFQGSNSQSTLKQPCKLSNRARRHRQIRSYVVCLRQWCHWGVWLCVCVWFLFKPHGTSAPSYPPSTSSLPLPLFPPRNKARHCVQESPF